MNWLFPGFLAGGALVGLPLILHFLRRRPQAVVPFPSLRFLGETALRDTRRHRLRRWLALLLRCLVVGLIAAAFARPFWTNAAAADRSATVIALDVSMSMAARGRWEDALAWALRQLEDARPGDEAAVLLIQPAPVWLVPMTDDLPRVRSALRAARPGYGKTRYAPALQVAGDALAASPAGTKTLVWVADEQRVGWLGVDLSHPLPPGVRLRLAPAPAAPVRQAAVVTVRRLPPAGNAPGGVAATVRLFQPAEDMRRVAVQALDGRTLAEQTLALHAGDNAVELRYVAPPDAPGVRVVLTEPDDLPADDAAWLAAESTTSGQVLLDPVAGTDFLAHALHSTRRLDAGASAPPVPLPDGPWPPAAVAVVRGAAAFGPPLAERLDRFADAGGPLLWFVDGSPGQVAWLGKRGVRVTLRPPAPEGGAEHLRDWDLEHSILAPFAGGSLLPLLAVEFYGGFDLAGDALLPVANWPDGHTALAEWNTGGRRVLLAGFPLDRAATDWPAQPSFVPFVHQAVRWLGAGGAARDTWRVGDAIPLPPGEGTWRALDAPAPPPERPAAGSVRPTGPGLYEFTTKEGAHRVFAVNTIPEESDLAPWPDLAGLAALQSREDAPSARTASTAIPPAPPGGEAAENRQRLWWWALALCGGCLLAELALANRTAL